MLRHLNLTIPQGKFTALVGPSGGGKSTIARLTARFWDVTGGSITLGGQDIRKLPLKQLSQSISFVTQDNFLFDCPLKENIRLGRPGASDEEVLAAAQAAQCEEFIGRLEHGWDTTAGDAGKQLSGGERQRIAIARAILKDAPIVIWTRRPPSLIPRMRTKSNAPLWRFPGGKRFWSSPTGSPPSRTRTRSWCWRKGALQTVAHRKNCWAAARCIRPFGRPMWGHETGRSHPAKGGELRCFTA